MYDVRVSESVEDVSGIRYEKILVAIHAWDDFVKEAFVHERRNKLALHTLFYSVEACLVSSKDAHCMCSIEDSDLSCSVECHIWCPDDVKSCLSCRKFVLVTSLLILDSPEKELLCSIKKIVLIAKLVADCLCFCSWITWNNSVYK